MEIDTETAKVASASIGSLLAALWARSAIKRRWSRDKVAGAYDAAEIDLLSRYENRITQLEAENRALRVENQQLGELRGEVRSLKEHIQRLEGQIAELMRR